MLFVLVQFQDDFERVVRLHPGNHRRQIFDAQAFDDVIADGFVQFREHFRLEIVAQDFDHAGAFVRVQALQKVGRVGMVKLRHEGAHSRLVPRNEDVEERLLGFRLEVERRVFRRRHLIGLRSRCVLHVSHATGSFRSRR